MARRALQSLFLFLGVTAPAATTNETATTFDTAGARARFEFDGLFKTSVFTAAATITGDRAAIGLGQDALLSVTGASCFSRLSADDRVCGAPANASLFETEVTARGTLFWGVADWWVCTDGPVDIPVADGDGCGGAVVVAPPPLAPKLAVGSLSQLHRPDVQIATASFMGFPHPLWLTGAGGALGAVFVLCNLRSGAATTQLVLDGMRYSFAWAMVIAGVSNTLCALSVGIETMDLWSRAGDVLGMLGGLACFFHMSLLRSFLGEDKVRCFCKTAGWSSVCFALTGNSASAIPLLQGIANGFARSHEASQPVNNKNIYP